MVNQFLTFCRYCGMQILMTRCEDTGRWVSCNPVIQKYRPDGGHDIYVNTEGMISYGTLSRNGEYGYQLHGRTCSC